ncbi:MAG TPA: outer membrane beta-barrel protein [Candidatus Angelobacter sp.]|nr:outer membrane beta-barrel protein [Candidatus Angelobacter sp.]
MKFNKWTLGLAAGGVVSLASAAQADEAKPMSQVQTAVSATTLSGYVDTSIIWKPGTGDANLPGRAFDGVGKLDGFNLNVVELNLEKPLSEDQWAAGYKVSLLAGPDANNFNTSPGGLTFGGSSDFSVKEAYVALRMPVGNGLDWKIGSFNTIIGYESFESYLNPNYSRSFGWQLEPTQHTGVLATYKASDAVSLSAGMANTWNAGINARATRATGPATESEKTYMASVSITAPDSWGFLKGSAWYAGIIDGLAGAQKDTTSAYIGGSLNTPVEGLSVGAAFDYRWDGPNTIVTAPASTWAYAIAGYASFQASEKWKFNARLDYTEGTDGTFYNRGGGGANLQNRLGAATITADYALWANVVSRAELRWDHSMSGDKPYGGTTVPNQRNAVTLALNLIYKF